MKTIPIPGKVKRAEAAKVREFASEKGLNKIACSAFQIVDGPDAGRWCGMGCALEERNSLGDCLFTTQPVSYPNRERAAQGAMHLMALIISGKDEVLEDEGDEG